MALISKMTSRTICVCLPQRSFSHMPLGEHVHTGIGLQGLNRTCCICLAVLKDRNLWGAIILSCSAEVSKGKNRQSRSTENACFPILVDAIYHLLAGMWPPVVAMGCFAAMWSTAGFKSLWPTKRDTVHNSPLTVVQSTHLNIWVSRCAPILLLFHHLGRFLK